MTSAIDITKPSEGNATTGSVRANFEAARDEIEALQAADIYTARPLFYKLNQSLQAASPWTLTPYDSGTIYWKMLALVIRLKTGNPTFSASPSFNGFNELGASSQLANMSALAFDANSTTRQYAPTSINTTRLWLNAPNITHTSASSTPATADIFVFGYRIP